MSAVYDWRIRKVDVAPQKSDQSDVVYKVHWSVSATDGAYSSEMHGSDWIEYVPNGQFIERDNLTDDIIIGWVQASIDEHNMSKLMETLDRGIRFQADLTIEAPAVEPMEVSWARPVSQIIENIDDA